MTSFQPAHLGQAISVVTYSCSRPAGWICCQRAEVSCRFHVVGGVADHLAQAGTDGDEVVLGFGELVAQLVIVVSEFGVGVKFLVGV